ncbi:hypothetical protein KY285_021189 [Solanum tuberosum]|nr:hypothetical protein KY284_021242 [Solanum tuberosum]KAH0680158.1 hypothetical protein KY284_021243 [Solanum tuberosum]KAH0694091.1 hypothetical protein KY285_021188 [Solanum tuberosum]KAH0694092.1 hypothetical protein KY285_021189 [Solanum tuberosum]
MSWFQPDLAETELKVWGFTSSCILDVVCDVGCAPVWRRFRGLEIFWWWYCYLLSSSPEKTWSSNLMNFGQLELVGFELKHMKTKENCERGKGRGLSSSNYYSPTSGGVFQQGRRSGGGESKGFWLSKFGSSVMKERRSYLGFELLVWVVFRRCFVGKKEKMEIWVGWRLRRKINLGFWHLENSPLFLKKIIYPP